MTGNDTWTGTLSLDEPTLVVIDVIADPESFSSDDLMIEVIGADGFTAENDDRGQFLNFGDANTLDPALGAELAAGSTRSPSGPTGAPPRATSPSRSASRSWSSRGTPSPSTWLRTSTGWRRWTSRRTPASSSTPSPPRATRC